jgi:short-subunit dehydrogenase
MTTYYLIFGANSDIAKEIYNYKKKVNYILISKNNIATNLRKGDIFFKLDLSKRENYYENIVNILNKYSISKIFLIQGFRPDFSENNYLYKNISDNFRINLESFAIILNTINRNQPSNLNEIIIFGSVAGDRGKSTNPVYDASKSGLHELARGYRSIFKQKKINVLLVKPGNIDTKMTKDIIKKYLWVTTKIPATDVLKNLNKNKFILYTPWFWRWIMLFIKILPEYFFDLLQLDKKNNVK